MRVVLAAMIVSAVAAFAQPLPGTALLDARGDLALEMVAGVHRYLDDALEDAVAQREQYWARDFSSADAYVKSVEPNRQRLARIIGVVDERVPARMELMATTERPAKIAESETFEVYSVRWPVLEGIHGEGLLLEPKEPRIGSVIALPDCDWSPEMLVGLVDGLPPAEQFARQLAEQGLRVLVPVLISRDDTFSGVPGLRSTEQSHREYIYRSAFQMGRHIIGYEVQKALACVDWFASQSSEPIGVMGYGEGGVIAMYAAALDTRIDCAVVSSYFGPRENLWKEPIYRNAWGLLTEFGDAEVASLIAPRKFLAVATEHPDVGEAPTDPDSRRTPGQITTPISDEVRGEAMRAGTLVHYLGQAWPALNDSNQEAVHSLCSFFGAEGGRETSELNTFSSLDDPGARMKRQIEEIIAHNELLVARSPEVRAEFWEKAYRSSVEAWASSAQWYRDYLRDEVIGRLPNPTNTMNPLTRVIYDTDAYVGYEVMLDVLPEVYAYGILLVPKALKDDEQRPVVVCQHGLEGRPQEIVDADIDSPYYHHYGADLAREGFIVYAPQNPYIGDTKFRQIQRKANPLKLSLFSFITAQHQQTLRWLKSLPFVDDDRIAFYGLSYGGKTAMRVPALLADYCLSICSGDFNEWIWKTTSYRAPFSYAFTHEYEMYEFNLGNTFNYYEMSTLIFPRPFMVERGHGDGVSIDEWVAYEYAKVRRFYDTMALGERTAIAYFDGPHMIHGEETFAFLRKQLRWPQPTP